MIKQIQRILAIAMTVLFLLLMFASLTPLSYGGTTQYVVGAETQLARSAAFAKNALLLEYGTSDEQVQALADMQVALPLFESEQSALQRNNDQSVQSALSEARTSYLAIDTAVKSVLALSQAPADSREVQIIVLNSRTYNIAMTGGIMTLQNQANGLNTVLVIFQEVVTLLIIGGVIWLQWLWIRRVRSTLLGDKNKEVQH